MRLLAEAGTTVLLTTHYLDEADQLCDRISVIDDGRNFIEDTPSGLKKRIGDERLEVAVADHADLDAVTDLIAQVVARDPEVDSAAGTLTVPVPEGVRALTNVAADLRAKGIEVADIGLRRPTLDEAFLHLTGRPAQSENAATDGAATDATKEVAR